MVSERKVRRSLWEIMKRSRFLSIPDIRIGNVSFSNIAAMKYDMDVLDMFNAHGIIGANLMAKGVWEFDIEK